MNLVKESLARLLAQEDLIVESRNVETAQFNVETRVLTLPNWKHETTVVDSLIAHEVGHALYTPNEWGWQGTVPMQFVNVCEDIRIEKLMKRRYEGIPKTFFKGYKILADQDFFQIEDRDLSTFNLADRMNIHYKVGSFAQVPFKDEEKQFLDKADKLETFEDALALAKEIFAYTQEELEKKQKEEAEAPNSAPVGKGGNSPEDSNEEGEEQRPDLGKDNTDYEGEGQQGQQGEEAQPSDSPSGRDVGRNEGGTNPIQPTVETADALEEKLKDLVNTDGEEMDYIEIPNKIDSKHFISNKEVSEVLDSYYRQKEDLINNQEFADDYELQLSRILTTNLRVIDLEYNKFKASSNKEVNYLVKEFEMKKSADAYARTTTARTGVLDTAKLHTYKYNEDLFRKVTVIPEGKNHGLIFNVDWSGSMSSCIIDTVKQVLTLVSFCRKVGIAYDVYLFSDNYGRGDDYNHAYKEDMDNNGKVILRNFSMLNILSSESNNRKHERQSLNFFRLANAFRNDGSSCGAPHSMGLSGTPLNEAVVSLNQILPEFKQRTGCQKVHVINLTDGEGFPLRYGKKSISTYTGEESVIGRNCNPQSILRDRKTGRQYSFSYDHYGQTNTFIYQLRDRFPECEFMNIRLCTGSEWNRFKRSCLGGGNWDAYSAADAEWRKTRSFICLSSAYTVQYALATSALNADDTFEVKEDAKKADIKRAFTKSLKGKKMNKKILSSFIERIA